jgi:PAS domain S-box-containing protein
MTALPFKSDGAEPSSIRRKLTVIEALIIVLPFLVFSYILNQGHYDFEISQVILFGAVVLLIVAGILILRQIFDGISLISQSLKKVDTGNMTALGIKADVKELHDISVLFNALVQRLEQTKEEMGRRAFELLTIKELAEVAKTELSLDDLMNIVLERSMAVVGAQIGSVLVVEHETRQTLLVVSRSSPKESPLLKRLRVAGEKGHDEELKKGAYIDIEHSLAKSVLLGKKPLLIRDIEKDQRTLRPNHPKYGSPAFLIMPILIGNEVVAILNQAKKKNGQAFDDNDEQVLSIMFRDINFALENAMLHSRVKEQLEKIKRHNIELEKEIEGRKRSERALTESERQFRSLVENSNDIIYTINLSGKFLYMNPVAARITGFPEEELMGKHYLSLVRPDFHEELKILYKKQFYENISRTYAEFPIIIADGTSRWIGQNVQPLMKDDKVVGFHAIARDINDRIGVEEALRKSNERFRTLTDATFEGIVIHENGRILDINRAAMEMFGYGPDVVGKSVVEFVSPDSMASVLLALQESRDKKGLHLEVDCIRKDGSIFPVELLGTTIPYNHTLARVMAIRDMTEQKKLERALQESERKYRYLMENLTKSP